MNNLLGTAADAAVLFDRDMGGTWGQVNCPQSTFGIWNTSLCPLSNANFANWVGRLQIARVVLQIAAYFLQIETGKLQIAA